MKYLESVKYWALSRFLKLSRLHDSLDNFFFFSTCKSNRVDFK